MVLAALGCCGCALVGPQSITAGRGTYTEVINRTEDEQILNVLVRQRYDETFGMISVASITANLRFSARTEANIGFGDSDNYAGNLVPLAAGVGYEENPTISYVPLSGEDFTRRMLSPISVSEWSLLGYNARHPGHVLALAAQRINGLRNPGSVRKRLHPSSNASSSSMTDCGEPACWKPFKPPGTEVRATTSGTSTTTRKPMATVCASSST